MQTAHSYPAFINIVYRSVSWSRAAMVTSMWIVVVCGCTQKTREHAPDVSALLDRGNAHLEKDEYEQATTFFTEAISIAPNDFRGYLYRSHVFMEQYEHEKEIADLTEVIRLKPDAEAYRNRGSSYIAAKDYPQAITDLTEAIRLEPGFTAAYETRAYAHFLNKDFQMAIPDFTRVIDARPTDSATYVRRAECYEKIGKRGQAAADRLKAINLDRR